MAKRAVVGDQIVKLIVGAGQASPSPPVGPALGSKGVKSMDFCKVHLPVLSVTIRALANKLQEFNARTANWVVGTPVPARVTVRPDRSFHFEIRTPPTAALLMSAAGVKPVKNKPRGAGNTAGSKGMTSMDSKGKTITQGSSTPAGNSAVGVVGKISLKHVYEIAKIKQSETRLSGLSLEGLVKSVVAQAGSIGILIVP